MELPDIARELIDLVSGISTEKTIEGVVEVLKGIQQRSTNDWEQYLAQETNDVLMRDRIGCPICNSLLEIERTRTYVAVRDL